MSQTQTQVEEANEENHILPKRHSLVAVPTFAAAAASNNNRQQHLTQGTMTQDDPNLTQVEEDLSLDLPQGENWMCLMTSSSLLSTQNTTTTPVLVSILPWSSLPHKDDPQQQPLYPVGNHNSRVNATSSFLMIDIDGEHCTVKDIRTQPPVPKEQQQPHDDDDIVDDNVMQDDQEGKQPPELASTHYRISICRRQQTLSLPSTWEHLSFTRQLRHVEPGDRVVLWETANFDVPCVPSVANVRCVWEKTYTATVEMTTNNEDDMMVSQLEDNETYTEPAISEQPQFLFTQASAGGEASLGGGGQVLTQPQFFATQPESALRLASQIGSAQKSSPSQQHNDVVQEEDDDETVDPREGMHEEEHHREEVKEGATKNGNICDSSPETNRSLRTNLQECLALASALKDEKEPFQTPQKTKLSGGTSSKLRSPDLLEDGSSDDDEEEGDGDDNDNMAATGARSVARRVDKEYSPAPKEATSSAMEANNNDNGLAAPSPLGDKSADASGKDVTTDDPPSPGGKQSPAVPHAGFAEIDEERGTTTLVDKEEETFEDKHSEEPAAPLAAVPLETGKPDNMPQDKSQNAEATDSTTFFTPRMDESAAPETGHGMGQGEQDKTNAGHVPEVGGLLTQEDAKGPDEARAGTLDGVKDDTVDDESLNGEIREECRPGASPRVPEDQENQTPEKNSDHSTDPGQPSESPSDTNKAGKSDSQYAKSDNEGEFPSDPKGTVLQVDEERKIDSESAKAEKMEATDRKEADEEATSPTPEGGLGDTQTVSKDMTESSQNKKDAELSPETDGTSKEENGPQPLSDPAKKSSPTSPETASPAATGVPPDGEDLTDDKAINESISALVDLSSKSAKTPTTDEVRKGSGSPSVLDERRASARIRSRPKESNDANDTSTRKRKQAATEEARSTRSSRRNAKKEDTDSGTPKRAKKRKSVRGNASKLSMESHEICLMASSDAKLSQKDKAGIARLGMTLLNDEEKNEWVKVTHLLVNDKSPAKRSVKVMFAMCRAKFVVTTSWLRSCLEKDTIVPLTSRVDAKVPKHSEATKRITSESLDRSVTLRDDGKYILSDCAVAICRHVVGGGRGPQLPDIESLVEGAGGEWLGEIVPDTPSKRSYTIVLISEDPTAIQLTALERKHESVICKTVAWLFDTLMSQELAL